MEENEKIVYVCDHRVCKYCNSQCTHTQNIEHAKNFHKEGDVFFEDNTLNKKVENQAKQIRRLLKKIDYLETTKGLSKKSKPIETWKLENRIKDLVAENNQLKTLLAHYLLKAYEDRPELISTELKEMINRYAQDTEIERLLKGNN